ncbi:M50 family metallopeptidase [Paenibacillus senegalensis]|uniref:M50 family metallopeptidase n=1 Tax=Paenibacillus senegalensis TaxID=1465766 RepID=UPI000289FD6E|nr:M50 family metallopeptidase [Paenibacillus senegalensis]
MGRWIITIVFLVICAFFTRMIPYTSFFRNFNTMIHEFGHAITTLVLSGRVLNIELYADHSGVTRSAVAESWKLIPIGLSGYLIASLFAWFLFAMDYKNKQKLGLVVMTTIAAISLVFFVRNEFGIWWLIGFIVLNVIMIMFARGNFERIYYLIIAFLTLEESVFSAFSLVIYAYNDPAHAGDAALLREATGLPAMLWALVFTVFALWCAMKGLSLFAKKRSRPNRSPGGYAHRTYSEYSGNPEYSGNSEYPEYSEDRRGRF